MLGILIGSFAGFLQIVISYNLRKNEIASFVKTGAPRYLDNKNDVITGIRPIMLLYCAPALVAVFDQCFYSIFMRKAHADIDYKTIYGLVFGRVEVFVTLIVIVCCIPFIKSLNRVMARIERDEHEGARERFKNFMRFSNILFIPVSVFVFSVSDSLMTAVYGKSSTLASGLLMLGSALVYFGGFMVMFSWLINHMGKSVIIMLNVGVALVAHVAASVLFVAVLDQGAYGILLSVLVCVLVYDVLNLLELSKIFSNRQEYVKTFLMPILSSAVAGVIVFLLNRLLSGLIGEILTLIICVVLFWFAYMLTMIFSRGIRAHELRRVFLGSLFYGIARAIQPEEKYEG
jgi:O-antigen/teichoic acid export membrane protein